MPDGYSSNAVSYPAELAISGIEAWPAVLEALRSSGIPESVVSACVMHLQAGDKRPANGADPAASLNGQTATIPHARVTLMDGLYCDPEVHREAVAWFTAPPEMRGPPPRNDQWLYRSQKVELDDNDEHKDGSRRNTAVNGNGADGEKKRTVYRSRPIRHPPGGPLVLQVKVNSGADPERLDEAVEYLLAWIGRWDKPPIRISGRSIDAGKHFDYFGVEVAGRQATSFYTRITRIQSRVFEVPVICHPRSTGMQRGPTGWRYINVQREDYFNDGTRVYEMRDGQPVVCDLSGKLIRDGDGRPLEPLQQPDPDDIEAFAAFLDNVDPSEPGLAGRGNEQFAYASGGPIDGRDLVPLREAAVIIGPSELGKTTIATFIAECFAPYPAGTTSDYHPSSDTARSFENVADAIKQAAIVYDDIHEGGGAWQVGLDGVVTSKADGGPLRRRNTSAMVAGKKVYCEAPVIITAEGLPGLIASRERRLLVQVASKPIDFDHFWSNRDRHLEIGRRIIEGLTVWYLERLCEPGGLERLRSRIAGIVDHVAVDLMAEVRHRCPDARFVRSVCRARADVWARAVILDEASGCITGSGLHDTGDGRLTERLRPHLVDLCVAQLDAMEAGLANVVDEDLVDAALRSAYARDSYLVDKFTHRPLGAECLAALDLGYAWRGDRIEPRGSRRIGWFEATTPDGAQGIMHLVPALLLDILEAEAGRRGLKLGISRQSLPRLLVERGIALPGGEAERHTRLIHAPAGGTRRRVLSLPYKGDLEAVPAVPAVPATVNHNDINKMARNRSEMAKNKRFQDNALISQEKVVAGTAGTAGTAAFSPYKEMSPGPPSPLAAVQAALGVTAVEILPPGAIELLELGAELGYPRLPGLGTGPWSAIPAGEAGWREFIAAAPEKTGIAIERARKLIERAPSIEQAEYGEGNVVQDGLVVGRQDRDVSNSRGGTPGAAGVHEPSGKLPARPGARGSTGGACQDRRGSSGEPGQLARDTRGAEEQAGAHDPNVCPVRSTAIDNAVSRAKTTEAVGGQDLAAADKQDDPAPVDQQGQNLADENLYQIIPPGQPPKTAATPLQGAPACAESAAAIEVASSTETPYQRPAEGALRHRSRLAVIDIDAAHILNDPKFAARIVTPPASAGYGELIAFAEREGLFQVWLTPRWCAAAGLPVKLSGPAGDRAWRPHHGMAHPLADGPPGDWRAKRTPGHIYPWADFASSTGELEIAIPGYGLGVPALAEVPASTLIEALRLFKQATGFWFRVNATAMLPIMLRRFHAGRGTLDLNGSLPATEFPPPAQQSNLVCDNAYLRGATAIELAENTFVHAYDANRQYATAWASLPLGFGVPAHVDRPTFDRKRVGYWRARVSRPPGLPNGFPHPCWMQRGDRPETSFNWYVTPTVALASELGSSVEVIEAWLFPHTHQPLQPLYQRFNAAAAALMTAAGQPAPTVADAPTLETSDPAAASLALLIVKQVPRAGTGNFDARAHRGADTPYDLFRPDWRHCVIAKARANLLRAVHRAGLVPIVIETDTACVLSPHADPVIAAGALKLDAQGGHFKSKWTVPITALPRGFRGKRTPSFADLRALKAAGAGDQE